ncbi:hypothetical protein E6C60_4105 [Paenibacillus algicola]|uniref:YqcI/YcgG family protein n=1 Tax=Paenibacillus algicola TaxID=2565926 RepID=A0A4P8XS42_9BACL|nr:YqcI/YcgG family protein [Paenibacillus algicola]QCT04810.1 hypothetical protein E6C60_4105 [Paenibacillus algicola]
MEILVDKKELEAQLDTLPPWKREAFTSFASIIADSDNTYPCIPGRQGFLMNHLRYAFIGDPRNPGSAEQLAQALGAYGEISRSTGNYASLAVFVETPEELLQDSTVEDYRSLFWKLLNEVTSLDPREWPEGIPTDPTDPGWEFCFQGEPYFAFCATPAHVERRSRHFPGMLLAFQPRWVFDEMNASTVLGRKMKQLIRKRLVEYDGFPGHPDLKWYGQDDNHEWKQYFLSDDNSSPSKCPFNRMKQTISRILK